MTWWQIVLVVIDGVALSYFGGLFVLMGLSWLAGYHDDMAKAVMVLCVIIIVPLVWGMETLIPNSPSTPACVALS